MCKSLSWQPGHVVVVVGVVVGVVVVVDVIAAAAAASSLVVVVVVVGCDGYGSTSAPYVPTYLRTEWGVVAVPLRCIPS